MTRKKLEQVLCAPAGIILWQLYMFITNEKKYEEGEHQCLQSRIWKRIGWLFVVAQERVHEVLLAECIS
jgi:hypothetical protein